jgi:hypothetical protein
MQHFKEVVKPIPQVVDAGAIVKKGKKYGKKFKV